MKVDQQSLIFIQNVVKTAQLVKIESVIIEPNRIRAIDEDSTVLILHETNVPPMPFGSIGLNRLDVFSSRFEIAKSFDNVEVDALVEDSDSPFARALTMKGKGIKVDYRCANPATIAAPKVFRDTARYSVKMTPDAVLLMQKAQGAMGSDDVAIIGNKDGVFIEVSDINSDKLTFKFADTFEIVEEDNEDTPANFSHKYPIKMVTTLFKLNPSCTVQITTKGAMKIVVNQLDVIVIPRS